MEQHVHAVPHGRVLIAWGSKRGGTEGIARIIGEELERAGFHVTMSPADAIRRPLDYDAVIIGGALYTSRWHRDARRFIEHHLDALRRIPVWLFSSGPLDDSANESEIPPTTQVAVLMERVGAIGHATFGGRLDPHVRGFPAAAMARTMSGDFRSPARIRAWASQVAAKIGDAKPRPAIEPPGRALRRMIGHGAFGWAVCTAAMSGLLSVTSSGTAIALHAIVAPLVFAVVSIDYFRDRGARAPLPTALAFAASFLVLDAVVVAGLMRGSYAMFVHPAEAWLPSALIFAATWLTGLFMGVIPRPGPRPHAA